MKKNKKLCLISINSYNELTGGGVYLRTLVSFLQKQNVNLTLIDKNPQVNYSKTILFNIYHLLKVNVRI